MIVLQFDLAANSHEMLNVNLNNEYLRTFNSNTDNNAAVRRYKVYEYSGLQAHLAIKRISHIIFVPFFQKRSELEHSLKHTIFPLQMPI